MKNLLFLLFFILAVSLSANKVDISVLNNKKTLLDAKWDKSFIERLIPNHKKYFLTEEEKKQNSKKVPYLIIPSVKNFNGIKIDSISVYKEKKDLFKIMLRLNHKKEFGKEDSKLYDSIEKKLIEKYSKKFILKELNRSAYSKSILAEMFNEKILQWNLGNTTIEYSRLMNDTLGVIAFTHKLINPVKNPYLELLCNFSNKDIKGTKEILIKIDKDENKWYLYDTKQGKIESFNKDFIILKSTKKDKKSRTINYVHKISRISGKYTIIVTSENNLEKATFTGKCSKYIKNKF